MQPRFKAAALTEQETGSGWPARLALRYGLRGRRTRLLEKSQRGPLTLQRAFYPEGDTCHNYILHPPGGVVGGDSLQIDVRIGDAAHALFTTPGASKFYRSGVQRTGRQVQYLQVSKDAVMEWLPQHNIYFPGAHVALETHIEVASGGRFMGWEMHCFGRPCNDETFTSGALHSATRLSINGELRLVEQLNSQADANLCSAVGLRGRAMQGGFMAAPCGAAERDVVEQILHCDDGKLYTEPVGLTLVDEVLMIRALSQQAQPMAALFTRLWSGLRSAWLAKAPCVPRIWAT